MQYPYMLIMRNTPDGCIWQSYIVENDTEEHLITNSARSNGFLVNQEELGYTSETSPGWRETQDWKDYLAKYMS